MDYQFAFWRKLQTETLPAGTTGLVADRLRRNALVIELNPVYAEMARRRIRGDAPLLTEVA